MYLLRKTTWLSERLSVHCILDTGAKTMQERQARIQDFEMGGEFL